MPLIRSFVAPCALLCLAPLAYAQAPGKPDVREAARPAATLQKPADGAYPSGRVVIAYSLEQAAGRVDIDILDANGAVVAGWTGGAAAQAAAPADRFTLPEALTRPGSHSIAWDLRASGYFGPGTPPAPSHFVPGPPVPPGPFTVQLTAFGQTLRQGFNVAAEPPLAPERRADLQARFDLAMQVRGRASAASAAVRRVRAHKERVAARLKSATDQETKEAGAALNRRLAEIEGVAGQQASASSGVLPLHDALAALLKEVEAGGRPTVAQTARAQELGAELSLRIVELNALASGSLARFERGEALPAGPSSPPFGAAAVQLDRKGVDFEGWVTSYVAQLKKRWIIPVAAGGQKARVVVALTVLRSGVVTGIDLVSASGVPALDESARGAVLAARPAPPLPEKYPDNACPMTITFYFNELPPVGQGK